ncbi:ABC transporter ATP-binding protein [Halocatena halophila]|uniref:ABC transporter ATP-binding protein n=1 Tax=Halocatena halophila TaxID=2814576 RepID=UPI002ED44ABE
MGNVQLTNVTKRYSDVVAVDGMDLDVEDGEFMTFVGPSGCGKSTTLEMVAGLTRPSNGTIEIDGKDVTDLPPKDRGIAMVFQNIALFPHMDVYDNISYGLNVRNVGKEKKDRQVDRVAEILQLDGMLERMPSELSGGQRQRVGIGRAIVRNPDVFLMDEPLANLDAKLRMHMRTELQRIQRDLAVTTIYVTHDQEEAMTMSDRIAVINDGELQQVAPPLECYNKPSNVFVAGFIGSPSMNFINGTISNEAFITEAFSIDISSSSIRNMDDNDAVIVGIRPEDVTLADAAGKPTMSRPITATVDVLEPIGEQILVYLRTEHDDSDVTIEPSDANEAVNRNVSDELLMSVDPDSDITEEQEVDIVFDRRNLHFFDARSGNAIHHGLAPAGDTTAETR